MSEFPLRSGVNYTLEEQADAILAEGRRGITKHSEMKDYLSPSQLERRLAREVYNGYGVADSRLVSGMFKRVYAPPRRQGPREEML